MIVELRYFFRERYTIVYFIIYHKFNCVHEMKNEYE